jgi:hypothetical protein
VKIVDAIVDLFFPPEPGETERPPKIGLLFFLILLFILLWGSCR